MAILQSVRQLAASSLDILQTRLELAATDIDIHLEYLSGLLLRSLLVLFCLCSAVTLLVILVLAIFWDTHRIEIICALIAVFVAAGLWLLRGLRQQVRSQPRLLAASLDELARDVEALRGQRTGPQTAQDGSQPPSAGNDHV